MAEPVGDDLEHARFVGTRLNGARIHDALMDDVKITGTSLRNAQIWSNGIAGLTINGVEVAPFVEAELDRRHPERRNLRATDADGVRRAWDDIESVWNRTLERALLRPSAELRERIDELEWSFVETVRHLIYVDEKFLCRVEGRPDHFSGIALAHTSAPSVPPGVDPDARPDADDVLSRRRQLVEDIRNWVRTLDDAELDRELAPRPARVTVLDRVRTLLWEEWLHLHYANRDLATLEAGRATA